jgi:hypothetical protein
LKKATHRNEVMSRLRESNVLSLSGAQSNFCFPF